MPTPSAMPMAEFVPPWPPDLSQLIPDLGVALVTGAAVGIFVIIAERVIHSRTTAKENTTAQQRVVVACNGSMLAPVTYTSESLAPVDSDIRRIRQKVRSVPTAPVSEPMANFHAMSQFLEYWELTKVASQRVETQLDRLLGKSNSATDTKRRFRKYLHASIGDREKRKWEDWWARDLAGRSGVQEDKDLQSAVAKYVLARSQMEGWRRAYLVRRKARLDVLNRDAGTRIDPNIPINRQIRRLKRNTRKQAVEADQNADLEFSRAVRTIHAKALHRVEDIFGRDFAHLMLREPI